MLPANLATQTLRILAPGMRLDYGREVPDWDNPIVVGKVEHCSVQPEQATEIIDGREATVWRMRVWAPLDAPVTSASHVRWRDADYRVAGEVLPWVDPTSRGLDHITFTITAWKG